MKSADMPRSFTANPPANWQTSRSQLAAIDDTADLSNAVNSGPVFVPQTQGFLTPLQSVVFECSKHRSTFILHWNNDSFFFKCFTNPTRIRKTLCIRSDVFCRRSPWINYDKLQNDFVDKFLINKSVSQTWQRTKEIIGKTCGVGERERRSFKS